MDQNTVNGEGCGRTYKDEVCANVQKIYDTCKDKDCLADMRVYFPPESQMLIDKAISIRAKSARICYSDVDLEPVPFNRGYYSVNIAFVFLVDFEVYTGCSHPQIVTGICSFDKKVILFGGEGNTTTFTSAAKSGHCNRTVNIPTAEVEIVDPIVLGSKLLSASGHCPCACETDIFSLPEAVQSQFTQGLCDNGDKIVLCSLGLFSIVRIVRDIQVMLPYARFCMPEKRCKGPSDEEPCSFFEKLSFPTGEFFPRDIGIDVDGGGGCGCGCGCND